MKRDDLNEDRELIETTSSAELFDDRSATAIFRGPALSSSPPASSRTPRGLARAKRDLATRR